jgi:hypothetical protein
MTASTMTVMARLTVLTTSVIRSAAPLLRKIAVTALIMTATVKLIVPIAIAAKTLLVPAMVQVAPKAKVRPALTVRTMMATVLSTVPIRIAAEAKRAGNLL